MKRFTHLAKIKNYLLASCREMADLLNVSVEAYKKYENLERTLPVSAQLMLAPLEAAFIHANAKFPHPPAIYPIRNRLWSTAKDTWKGRLNAIQSDLIRFSYTLIKMRRNADAANHILNHLKSSLHYLPVDDPFYPAILRSIQKTEKVLQDQGPEKQEWLEDFINSLRQQEEILMRWD